MLLKRKNLTRRCSQPPAGVAQDFYDSNLLSRCHARSRQRWLILFSLGPNRRILCLPDAFDSLPRGQESLTTVSGYRAMVRLLEYYFHVDSEFPVGAILGELASGFWADGLPGDPAVWTRWLESIDETQRRDSTKA